MGNSGRESAPYARRRRASYTPVCELCENEADGVLSRAEFPKKRAPPSKAPSPPHPGTPESADGSGGSALDSGGGGMNTTGPV